MPTKLKYPDGYAKADVAIQVEDAALGGKRFHMNDNTVWLLAGGNWSQINMAEKQEVEQPMPTEVMGMAVHDEKAAGVYMGPAYDEAAKIDVDVWNRNADASERLRTGEFDKPGGAKDTGAEAKPAESIEKRFATLENKVAYLQSSVDELQIAHNERSARDDGRQMRLALGSGALSRMNEITDHKRVGGDVSKLPTVDELNNT